MARFDFFGEALPDIDLEELREDSLFWKGPMAWAVPRISVC